MPRTNDVTLFSNGIGHFRRVYKIVKGQEDAISIPFKRDNIGDVAASLQVFGAVRLNSPPSFTPMNSLATALRIDPKDAIKSLLRNLSGAVVTVDFTDGTGGTFTLLGLDSDVRTNASGTAEQEYYIVLLSDANGVARRKLSDVVDVRFEEEGVRTEITKALKTNFQLIKPDSTLMDLSLTALDDDTEAVVQYTIPVAAWKMRYAIREDKGKFTLEGAAIIDNNTDEDWDNFKVSVVTGNPISFATDIANVCTPNRKQIKLVDNDVLGNVAVEEGARYARAPSGGHQAVMAACASPSPGYTAESSRSLGSKFSVANYSQAGFPSDDSCSLQQLASGETCLDEYDLENLAEAPGVDSKEVGDFCVFTAKEPITILARKSAVVPMFTVPLSKAGVVLLYREASHARRPYRAVKFKNETEYSLGKGKTVIYNEGIFSGECVLETTKPGENRMLPHCLENGVKIVKEVADAQSTLSSLKIAEGVAITEHVSTCKTTYTIENKKDENFSLAIEHVFALDGHPNIKIEFEGVKLADQEKLVSGRGSRAYLELGPKESVTLVARETSLESQHVGIGQHYNYPWLSGYINSPETSLAENKQVLACVRLQEDINTVNQELANFKTRLQDLTSQAQRVRENLSAAKDVANTTTVAEWVKDLDTTEQGIRTINQTNIPTYNQKLRTLQNNLSEELKRIAFEWKHHR